MLDLHQTSNRPSPYNHETMSRKRLLPAPSPDTPSKRYLNAALATELNALRISNKKAKHSSPSSLPSRNAFGSSVFSSPFLSQRQHPYSYSQQSSLYNDPQHHPVSFGSDFATSLQEVETYVPADNPFQPVITTPDSPTHSSSSSMAVDDELSVDKHPISDDEEIMVYDITNQTEEIDQEGNPLENRLVLYNSPVRADPTVRRFNGTLNSHSSAGLSTPTEDWIRDNWRAHQTKKRLALVPWRSEHQRLHPSNSTLTKGGRAIPMPWYSDEEQDADQFQGMEIEEI